MSKQKFSAPGIGAALMMICLILDSKTSLAGASEGINLCIRTVIPSLFPFFFLTGILNTFMTGKKFKFLRPLGKLCGMPVNSEYLLLIGFTGGYPVGAQCISNSYNNGVLTKQDAERMLGFCSNAGPAFIFGMISQMFPASLYVWLLWIIQILCALITGLMLPGKSKVISNISNTTNVTIQKALENAIKAMSAVCGWVMLFRVIITFLNRWMLWLFPEEYTVIFLGVLELSNGCIALNVIEDISLRFIAASFMLSLGGVCVGMQTLSVCQKLSCTKYFIGKAMQALLSVPISMILVSFLFPGNNFHTMLGGIMLVIIMLGFIFSKIFKKYAGKLALHHV